MSDWDLPALLPPFTWLVEVIVFSVACIPSLSPQLTLKLSAVPFTLLMILHYWALVLWDLAFRGLVLRLLRFTPWLIWLFCCHGAFQLEPGFRSDFLKCGSTGTAILQPNLCQLTHTVVRS